MRENRQHGSEGGEGDLPDPYRLGGVPHRRWNYFSTYGVEARYDAETTMPRRKQLTSGRPCHDSIDQTILFAFNLPTSSELSPNQLVRTSAVCSPSAGDAFTRGGLPLMRTGHDGIL